MKVLIVKCDRMLTQGIIVEEQKRIAKEFREDRVVVLGPGFEYEVVDVDDISVPTTNPIKPKPNVSYVSYRDRNKFDMNSTFSTYHEAYDLRSQMKKHIDKYGVISVADYIELIGLIPNYRDSKYGWNELNNSSIRHKLIGNRYFWELQLPEPIEI